jgi:hypothetical protein
MDKLMPTRQFLVAQKLVYRVRDVREKLYASTLPTNENAALS